MRTLITWRLTAFLLLVLGTSVTPVLDDMPLSAAVRADDGEGEEDENDQGDDNRGHGNDSDGHDEDNPGRGNENSDKKDKDDKDAGGGEEDGDGDNGNAVVQSEVYAVEVACEPDSASNSTTCVFTVADSTGAADIDHIELAEDDVCADVTGGTFEYVDPDSDTGITGYRSKSGDHSFTLVLEGDVTAGAPATYWIITSDGVFPATGPGLHCDETPAGSATQQPVEATADATGSTGTLVVNTYQCTDVPADTDSFDWFGACAPTGGEHEFSIARVDTDADDQDDHRSQESGASGSAAFDSLAAGTYQLEIVDTDWCHAESDNVTTEGDVVIESGQTTTVWGFVCDGGTKQ